MTEPSNIVDLGEDMNFWLRKYTEKGFRVLPLHGLVDGVCACSKAKECRSPGKHPIYGAWAAKATNDLIQASVEWQGTKASRNIGLAMGHGLVAVDIDGEDGRRSLEQLQAVHEWPDGPVAETGSAGLHFIFRSDESFKNTVKIVDGIDIRSEGGQIVACPSLHKSTRRYRWLDVDGTCSFDLAIPELPEWLASLLRGTAKLDFDIAGWLKEQPGSIEGDNGSATLMRVSGKIVRAGMARTVERFLSIIAPWNATCKPEWSERELAHAFDSAMSKFESSAVIQLPQDKNGQVILSRAHLHKIVQEDPRYAGQFKFCSRTMTAHYSDRPMTDADVTNIEVEICARYHIRSIPRGWVRESIHATTMASTFDPVETYLRSLKWDGVPRIAQVPADYMGCKPSPLLASMFRRWMIGAAKRVLEPGCQMDNVLILYSPEQGMRKTSFFRALAKGWHTETELDIGNKDVFLTLHRSWILEWSELSNIRRLEQARVKSFLTRTHDNFRPPYGHTNVNKPRAGVIAGSTNDQKFLDDPTGSRRFWILAVGYINTVKFEPVVDQLWAEAVALVAKGEQHWLTANEDEARAVFAETFTVRSELYKSASDVLDNWGDQISWEALCRRIEIEPSCGPQQRDEIVRALKVCGFECKRLRVDSGRKHFWCRDTIDGEV